MAEITIRISDKVLKSICLLLSAAIFIWVASYIWSSGFFLPKYRLRMYVPNATDLTAHVPVRVDGLEVGTVETINLAKGSGGPERRIELILRIEKPHQNEILSDSNASLLTEGILGNQYINIQRGLIGSPIPEGGEIRSLPTKTVTLKDFSESFGKWLDCVNKETHESSEKVQSP